MAVVDYDTNKVQCGCCHMWFPLEMAEMPISKQFHCGFCLSSHKSEPVQVPPEDENFIHSIMGV